MPRFLTRCAAFTEPGDKVVRARSLLLLPSRRRGQRRGGTPETAPLTTSAGGKEPSDSVGSPARAHRTDTVRASRRAIRVGWTVALIVHPDLAGDVRRNAHQPFGQSCVPRSLFTQSLLLLYCYGLFIGLVWHPQSRAAGPRASKGIQTMSSRVTTSVRRTAACLTLAGAGVAFAGGGAAWATAPTTPPPACGTAAHPALYQDRSPRHGSRRHPCGHGRRPRPGARHPRDRRGVPRRDHHRRRRRRSGR